MILMMFKLYVYTYVAININSQLDCKPNELIMYACSYVIKL